MNISIDRTWRVHASTAIELPLSASAVWGQMRHFERFMAADPLHARVRVETPGPQRHSPRGARLVISHRLLGIGPDRVGRILRWDEGQGFAFSDLSPRGPRVGFPHVCGYRVEPLSPEASRLTTYARGRWTATWIPRPVVRCWLAWVLRATDAALLRELMMLKRWQRNQA